MNFENIYRDYHNKILLIPFIFLLLFIAIIATHPLKWGIDFTGGILVSFSSEKPFNAKALEEKIKEITGSETKVTPLENGGFIECSGKITEEKKKEIEAVLESEGFKDITIREVAPSLGSTFWETAKNIALWAFILLSISVLIFFRQLVPAGIMIGSMIYDVTGMLALMALFGIPLTLETVTILLLLVGYSIDTDVVLSTFLLKRKEGDAFSRAARAASTGLHMTGTTFVAMVLILAVGYLTRNITVLRIGAVMIFGLLADIIVTWFLNAPLLLKWVRRHAKKNA